MKFISSFDSNSIPQADCASSAFESPLHAAVAILRNVHLPPNFSKAKQQQKHMPKQQITVGECVSAAEYKDAYVGYL
eukprot:m.240784 g.240784  ORF g.240784 m.240784 type:complete len:77 (-) comp15314_c1_seq1:1019-1249(-)